MDADDVVLVALINQPRDLEIVRAEHCYRIPAKHSPVHFTQARYIAFDLTKPSGDCKWSIREYAPVRGHELVRRRDLFPQEIDNPRAEDAYYKLQLGPLIALPRPMVSARDSASCLSGGPVTSSCARSRSTIWSARTKLTTCRGMR